MPVPQLPFLNFLTGGIALDNTPALCDDKSEGWMRYGALREAVRAVAKILAPEDSLFTKRGLVLCCLPRTIQGAVAYLGAAASGHALLMVDPGAARPDLYILAYQPDWVILPTAFHPGEAYAAVEWMYDDLFLWQRTGGEPEPVHPELFILLSPPGPPDSIKTVRLTYRNMAHNTQASMEALGLTSEARAVLHMPLSYSFGLSILHMCLSIGGSVMLTEHDIKNRALWDSMQKRDVTLFAGVPFHYEYLTRARLENLHVPRVKTFLQAGGRMPVERTQELMRQVAERRGELYILYGLTEASPRIASLPLHAFADKIKSLGRVISGGALKAEGRRITYHGPNVMMGYAQDRVDLAKGDEQGGLLLLGEDGFIDEDGFLYLE